MLKFKLKWNLKREVKIVIAMLFVVGLIAFSEGKQKQMDIQDVVILIDNIADNHFMEEKDVMSLMQLKEENLRGATINKVDLGMLENRIKQDRFVKNAELYTDLKGNLVVKVTLQRPVARIVQRQGPDGYIAEDGTIMGVSDRFTARVPLVSGAFVGKFLPLENLNQNETGSKLMAMLNIIRKDEFWHAQVAQIDIDSRAHTVIYPQVTKQYVEFGAMDNLEEKFKKLKIFYKEVLPRMGWNAYDRVNLEYEGQIVAE